MNCPDARAHLDDAFDLGTVVGDAVRVHLAACPDCDRHAKSLDALSTALDTLSRESVSLDIARRATSAVARARRNQRRAQVVVALGLLAAIVLLGFLAPVDPSAVLQAGASMPALESAWTRELGVPTEVLLDYDTWAGAWFANLVATFARFAQDVDHTFSRTPWTSNTVLAVACGAIFAFQAILTLVFRQRAQWAARHQATPQGDSEWKQQTWP